MHLLVRMSDGLKQSAGVARCAGIIGEVTDHQGWHRDIAAAGHAVTAGIVVAPLRQPTAQRAEPGQADGRVIDDSRVTQIAGARFAVIGIDGRIQHRITSYNVCYTKLLRIVDESDPTRRDPELDLYNPENPNQPSYNFV